MTREALEAAGWGDRAVVVLVALLAALAILWLVSRAMESGRLEQLADELAEETERATLWEDYARALETWATDSGLPEDHRQEIMRVAATRSARRAQAAR